VGQGRGEERELGWRDGGAGERRGSGGGGGADRVGAGERRRPQSGRGGVAVRGERRGREG
jgi:hypothetical protein